LNYNFEQNYLSEIPAVNNFNESLKFSLQNCFSKMFLRFFYFYGNKVNKMNILIAQNLVKNHRTAI